MAAVLQGLHAPGAQVSDKFLFRADDIAKQPFGRIGNFGAAQKSTGLEFWEHFFNLCKDVIGR